MISENRNEGEIAKSRRLRRVEGDSEIRNISSSNSQNQFFETKMVRQWRCTCHGTYLPKFSLSSFFSSPTTCCPSLPLCLPPLAWFIGSYAQGLWLSGSVDLVALNLLLSVCLQVPVLLSGSTLVLDPWLPWLVRVVEQNVVGDKLGCYWDGGEGGGITVLVYCSICSWSPNIICF